MSDLCNQQTLPNLAALMRLRVEAYPIIERPGLIAELERIAPHRYLIRASQSGDPKAAEALLACAAREEDIARRVEDIFEQAPDSPRPPRSHYGPTKFDIRELFTWSSICDSEGGREYRC